MIAETTTIKITTALNPQFGETDEDMWPGESEFPELFELSTALKTLIPVAIDMK